MERAQKVRVIAEIACQNLEPEQLPYFIADISGWDDQDIETEYFRLVDSSADPYEVPAQYQF